MSVSPTDPILDVRNLAIDLMAGDGATTRPVRDVSLTVAAGETLAVVGESGSGKTLTALAVMRLLPSAAHIANGEVRFKGSDLMKLPDKAMAGIRGVGVSMIFQDPLGALNPTLRIGPQIAEVLWRHQRVDRREAAERAIELMEQVGIPDARRRSGSFPHELSGGMRQRVVIAMAIALNPGIVLADEPTTALDVTIQAQIMRLLKQLQGQHNLALLLISHDLSVVASVADRLVVMYAGRVVEEGPLRKVYESPAHPYTLGLMRCVPTVDSTADDLVTIPGQPPLPGALPSGCAFHPRCPFATDLCQESDPGMVSVGRDHRSACHYASEVQARGG